MTINIKSAEDIEAMRHACRLASEVLDYIAPHIKPGITTKEIDRLGAECMAQQGTISATVGYQPPGYPPYPASLCTSVNHVVCHGIPNDKPLKKGDIVNVDVTVITKDGWYGDNSRMYLIGECSIAAKRLSAVTFEAMWHGIGQKFHEEPQVLHYGRPGTLEELQPGMVFTIEPMINAGKRDVKNHGNDGWTIVTKDHSLSAQWEHTVLVTPTGYEVMTLSAGSPPLPSFVTATRT